MIDRGEILEVASVRRLRPDVIEKDYVLGWMLAGIFSHSVLGPAWAFKGGTCLVYRNRRGGLNVEGRVYYRGPLLPRGSLPRVKLDLTTDEHLARPPVWRTVAHHYTDFPEGGMLARCYVFDELFGEKIRALGERARPRDLYDVVNLFWNDHLRPAASDVLQVVREKCRYKGIEIPNATSLEPFRDELTNDWETMLGHQLPALPPFGSFWDAIPAFFDWLQEGVTPIPPPGIPFNRGEVEISSETKPLDLEVGNAAILETIHFAATNRLCIDLRYGDSVHRVEPYSLRKRFDGALILYACTIDHSDYRSYPIESVQRVDSTGEPFVPRYFIDLRLKRLSGTDPLG